MDVNILKPSPCLIPLLHENISVIELSSILMELFNQRVHGFNDFKEFVFKVHMTWKMFSASLKGLSKYRRIALLFLTYLFSFQRYWHFSIMQIRSVMTSYCLQLKMVKYWINDISQNIEAAFLKLGTTNVHHKKKQNDTLNGVAIATLLAPVSFCPKNKYYHLQPLKWNKGCYLEQTQLPYCLNSHQ